MSRIDTVETTVFKFDELSEKAQQTAIEKLYNLNTDYNWWDYEDAKQAAACIGIEIDDIWFSGFSSQGDGACFEGSYSYQKGGVKAIKDCAPQDERLHQIAMNLQETQRKSFYGLSATVKHSGHYYHEYCTDISVSECRTLRDGCESEGYASIEAHEAIEEALRDFMRWIYKQLEKDYYYLTSEEAIKESIEANEYEFTGNGERY
ncbi:antitoxin of toxin-antitoxin stability system [Candidatus Pacearchaeota archaeon]|nr:antitoxin of toxin-antitoxin stability system [Candidatus Pacearchaeota archaeon]